LHVFEGDVVRGVLSVSGEGERLMVVNKNVRAELLASFQRLMKARGKEPVSPQDAPPKVLYPDAVPVSGSVHVALGRTVARTEINKRFVK
jgi:hypothetical protein